MVGEACAQEQVCGNGLCYTRQVAQGAKQINSPLVQSHVLDTQPFECMQSPSRVLC